MRRNNSAAEGRLDVTQVIERISAERHSMAATAVTGRHRHHAAPGYDVADLDLAQHVAGHDPDADLDTSPLVVTDPLPDRSPRRRTMARRLAPLAAGAVVMLVATTIATLTRPADSGPATGPDLTSALTADNTTGDPDTVHRIAPAGPTVIPNSGPAASAAQAPLSAAAAAASKAVEQATSRRPAPARPAPPAAPKPAPPAPAGDGKQVATAKGWTLVGGDEFNGGKSSKWGVYQGAGHAGQGRRVASAVTVENGVLAIRGDSSGATGGMAWADNQRFGKWEIRAKFPKGDRQYHPVLILWPEGRWPDGGEVDFAETNSAAPDVSFFLHYSSSNQQKYAKKALDLTQWHNYAVEWVDGRITGYIDGEKWFESTQGNTLPPGRMHATIQLDYFPAGGNPQPTEMFVDYMRIYQ